MDYSEATNFLFGLRRFGQRPGIESVRELLGELDNPHRSYPSIQIAGSNGKGSTARMTERILREAGFSVGLFMSPQVEQFRDRIRVDGRYISEQAVTEFIEEVASYVTERGADGTPPTFFEVTTAMALWYFQRRDVDVAVLEVGMGGSKDATSVVDPVASAVTSVTLEHSDILGDTIEEIARDKAHVRPAHRPLVTAATGTARSAIETFLDHPPISVGPADSRPVDVTSTYHGKINGTEAAITLTGPDWNVETHLPLLGAHQAENAGVAATLARQFCDAQGEALDSTTIERGLRQAHFPGRCEVRGHDPTTILDGAHNPGACRRLTETIAEFDYADLHLVVGAMSDKQHEAMAAALPDAATVTVTAPRIDRAADPKILARVFDRAGYETTVVEGVEDAVIATQRRADSKDCVVVTGSLYLVREARARWTRRPVEWTARSREEATKMLRRSGVANQTTDRTADRTRHRVVTLPLYRDQAEHLRELFQLAGGDCSIAAIDHSGERLRTTVMGTVDQFQTVINQLTGTSSELSAIGTELNEAITDRSWQSTYPWSDRTAVMGILNITPDSFHDGGEYNRLADARERAERMIDAGVDILDIGGESTRPGADPVDAATEIDRVVPIIDELTDLDAMLSVDTRKAEVAEAAIEAGADIINDVSGLGDPEMRFVTADHDVPVVLMHSIETPVDPGRTVAYDDVVRDVITELNERILVAEQAGVDREQIIIDPGLGFGKSAVESFELLDRLPEFDALGCPILVGHSHKSMFERAGYEHGERLAPTIAGTAIAADRGADIVRVHDVPENVAAVRTVQALSDR